MVGGKGALLLLACLLAGTCGCITDECRRACRHMLDDCGVERPGYNVEDCTAQCDAFVEHFEDEWQEQRARGSVRCVSEARCDDLRIGTPCYDEALYVW